MSLKLVNVTPLIIHNDAFDSVKVIVKQNFKLVFYTNIEKKCLCYLIMILQC